MRAPTLCALLSVAALARCEEIVLVPTSYQVTYGRVVGGGLGSLAEVDDNALRVQRFFEPTAHVLHPLVVFRTSCPFQSLSSLKLRVVIRPVHGGRFQHEFGISQLDGVPTMSERLLLVNGVYQTVEWTPPGDPNQYIVNGGLKMTSGVWRYGFPTTTYFYAIDWDAVQFVVTPT